MPDDDYYKPVKPTNLLEGILIVIMMILSALLFRK